MNRSLLKPDAPGSEMPTEHEAHSGTGAAQAWHLLSAEDACSRCAVNVATGLDAQVVEARRQLWGENVLPGRSRRSGARILLEQFRGSLILLLLVAAGVCLFLAEFVDAVAILVIVLLNAILGFLLEERAERAMEALQKLAIPRVKVRRAGRVEELMASALVPGDIVILESGGAVPADGRVVESANLQTQESALTGESQPVAKVATALSDPQQPVADRSNMVYLGTLVSAGHGVAVVTGTGLQTELGRIAQSLESVEEGPTPLQRRLTNLGRRLAVVAMGVVGVVFMVGMLAGEPPRLMLLTALSLAVAIVPEGLPAVATVVLALGARRMARRNALIRRLPAVETLGSVTVICADKTGTLTENRMAVAVLDVAGLRRSLGAVSAPGLDGEPSGAVSTCCGGPTVPSGLTLLLTVGTLCNDGVLQTDVANQQTCGVGDPTETAILVAAQQSGFPKQALDTTFPRVGEVPFNADRKCMSTIHRQQATSMNGRTWERSLAAVLPFEDGEWLVCTKGAADAVLQRSTYVWDGEAPVPLDAGWRRRVTMAQDELAGEGMRVLGLGFRLLDELPTDGAADVERELIFVGLLAMIDPPRAGATTAVRRCRAAGIRPVMITGDHARTASAIARTLGITPDDPLGSDGAVCTGPEIVGSDRSFQTASVYARVTPHDKLQIVKRLQQQGEIVAMTGDGVNDAPALKQADIGVAMGRNGTDVAKEAADMVLLDDDFSTIVNAVEEGRVVFDNIRKFVKYTMTSNAGELFVMLLGPLFGMPLPLLPLQILWINLVTDGLPGLALAVEPAEPGTMTRPPYRPREAIINRDMVRDIAWIGLLMAGVSLWLGYLEWSRGTSESAHWRTLIFTVLTISQMGNALASRSVRSSVFRVGLLSNKALLGAVLLTLGLQLAVLYAPPLQLVFRTVPLSGGDLMKCVLLGAVVFVAVEVQKLLFPQRDPPPVEGTVQVV